MASGANNWDRARVATSITFDDPSSNGGSKNVQLSLVNRVVLNTKFQYKPLHGLNEWNQGIIELPPEFTFTIAIPVVSPHVRLLRALHVSGVPFILNLTDVDSKYTDANDDIHYEYGLYKEILGECRITSKEINIVVGDVPMVVFTGMALRYSYFDRASMKDNPSMVGLNTDQYPTGAAFGDGAPLSDKISLFAEWKE